MMNYRLLAKLSLASLLTWAVFSCKDDPDPIVEEEETWEQISGLYSPMGVARDSKGRVWVTESGTGQNNARLSYITLSGQKVEVLTGLPSVVAMGAVEGMSRPYVKGETLYFAHGIGGKIYKLKQNASAVTEASLPLSESDFDILDVNAFARALPTSNDSNTNVMDLHLADNGDLYMLDAGANVIIKSAASGGALSVFAELPKLSGGGDAVPTGFVFDGTKFYVSLLSGFPFAAGQAKIVSVSTSGQVSDYKADLTNLVDVELNEINKPVVLQYATFAAGFAARTGAVKNEDGTVLLPDLNQPIHLVRKEDKTYYLLSFGDGTLKKITL